ncbi:MAG: hypothetical protein ABSF67_10915 [Roseiarcus sp.]
MSRVQHSKPSRRLGWAAAALVLLALPATAQAQGFFFLFGSPSPYEIERQLAASGYVLTGPLTMRGDVYLADVIVRGEGPERLVIDAQSGRVVERYRGRADRSREAAAPPPPSGWGDDPRLWNGPRPPATIGPDVAPPDSFAPAKPNVLEAPKADNSKLKPKAAETKPKLTPKPPTPVANVTSPPPAAVVPAPTATTPFAPPPAAASSPAAAPASPSPAPSAAAAASPSPAPAIEAAKADAPSVAKPPPPAGAPAKSKTVNDIPVTPLD